MRSSQVHLMATLFHARHQGDELLLTSTPELFRIHIEDLKPTHFRLGVLSAFLSNCSSHSFKYLKKVEVAESPEAASPGTPSRKPIVGSSSSGTPAEDGAAGEKAGP